MDQWVKYLLTQHEDLSLDPWHPHKKQGMKYVPVIPAMGVGRQAAPWGFLTIILVKMVSSRFSEKSCLKHTHI